MPVLVSMSFETIVKCLWTTTLNRESYIQTNKTLIQIVACVREEGLRLHQRVRRLTLFCVKEIDIWC